ncbi:MAG TPA: hypothetical protein VN176_01420 [Verrucomicrobiae bacterium]|jgi:hypothetical protein|nr:hypothetical protein [Verrucomicrobiae bacterium]
MASLSQYLSTLNKDRRLAVALPVKVISNEVGVAPQWSCTYEISRRGARLKHVRGVMVEGQEIWLKRLDVSAKYRVTWIGKDTGSTEGQFAAECMEDTTIWEDEINGKLQPIA